MGLHLGQFFRGQRQQLARPPPGLVPAFHYIVDHGALPGGAGIGIKPVERTQPQDGLSVELIGIAAQPVDRSHVQRDITLLCARDWLGLRIGWQQRGMIDHPRQLNRTAFPMRRGQVAQHGLHPQDKAAGDHRPTLVALGPA